MVAEADPELQQLETQFDRHLGFQEGIMNEPPTQVIKRLREILDIQTNRHTGVQAYRRTDVQTYIHTDMQTYIHACIHIYYMFVYLYVCMSVCLCRCVGA